MTIKDIENAADWSQAQSIVNKQFKGDQKMEKTFNSVEGYALKILSDNGCDCYTYGGEHSKYVLEDLKLGYPDGMEYPYVDVANAILAISKVRPIVKSQWRVIWNTEDCTDGCDCDSLEAAKTDAKETLINWMMWEREGWKDVFNPTEDELDSYNYMIENCYVYVCKYNPDTDEYEEYWSPSNEDEEELGWRELTMDDILAEKEAIKKWEKENNKMKAGNN